MQNGARECGGGGSRDGYAGKSSAIRKLKRSLVQGGFGLRVCRRKGLQTLRQKASAQRLLNFQVAAARDSA